MWHNCERGGHFRRNCQKFCSLVRIEKRGKDHDTHLFEGNGAEIWKDCQKVSGYTSIVVVVVVRRNSEYSIGRDEF